MLNKLKLFLLIENTKMVSNLVNAVILLGAPGAGKGTQTSLLCNEYGFFRVSTGDIIRAEVKLGSFLGKTVAHFQDKGQLVPDDLVSELVFSRLRALESDSFVFDGFPRTLAQAIKLDEYLQASSLSSSVVLVDVPFESIRTRILGRLYCPGCQSIFSSLASAAYEGMPCPCCGVQLAVRPDDNIEVLKDRYDIYNREIGPILEYYGSRVRSVDGTQPSEMVYDSLVRLLELKSFQC